MPFSDVLAKIVISGYSPEEESQIITVLQIAHAGSPTKKRGRIYF